MLANVAKNNTISFGNGTVFKEKRVYIMQRGLSMETESRGKPLPPYNLRQRGCYSSPTHTVVLPVMAVVLPIV